MTYEEIIKKLQDNHFYPSLEEKVGKSGNTITGLIVRPKSALDFIDIQARIQDILKDYGVKVSPFRKQGYLLIKKLPE